MNDTQQKQRRLTQKELAMKNSERKLDQSGPIGDVDTFIKNLGKK